MQLGVQEPSCIERMMFCDKSITPSEGLNALHVLDAWLDRNYTGPQRPTVAARAIWPQGLPDQLHSSA